MRKFLVWLCLIAFVFFIYKHFWGILSTIFIIGTLLVFFIIVLAFTKSGRALAKALWSRD